MGPKMASNVSNVNDKNYQPIFDPIFLCADFPFEKIGGKIGGQIGGKIGGQIGGQIGGKIGGELLVDGLV